MLPIWIGLFVIIDGVVVYLVLRKVMAKRQGLGGAGFSNIAQFAGTAAEDRKSVV